MQEIEQVEYLRMDNAGENKVLEQQANLANWKLGLKYKYVAPETPQHNHLAELALTSITNKGRTFMAAVNVPSAMRYAQGPKAFQYATKTDGLCMVNVNGVVASARYWTYMKHFYTVNLTMLR